MGNIEVIKSTTFKVNLKKLQIYEIDDTFTKIFGYTKEEVDQGKVTLRELIYEEDMEECFATMERLGKENEASYIGQQMRTKDNKSVSILCYGVFEFDKKTGERISIVTLVDVTKNKILTKKLNDVEQKLRLQYALVGMVAEGNREIFMDYSVETDAMDVFWLQKNTIKQMQYLDHYMKKREYMQFVHKDDKNLLYDKFDSCLEKEGKATCDVRYRCIDGSYEWFRVHWVSGVDEDGKVQRVCGRRFSIQKEYLEKSELKDRAELDSLTGIYNHRSYIDHVEERLNQLDSTCALLMIDIDEFKKINDTYGHQEGDDLLLFVATTIKEVVEEKGIVGRMGGDEFSAFIENVIDQQVVEDLCAVIHKALSKSKLGEELSVSIGIMLTDKKNENILNIYKKADMALYEAKRNGKNRHEFYKKSIEDYML